MELFKQLPCPSIITDLEGQILQTNDALLDIIDISSSLLENAYVDDLLTPASRIFMQTHIWPMVRSQTFINEAYITLKGSNKSRVPILLNCQSITYAENKAYCWILYVALERSKFEQELVKTRNELEVVNDDLALSRSELILSTKALNLANAELERFVYSISHDLKGPLVTISGFTKQLLLELEANLSVKQQSRFSRIIENAHGMDNMLTELLALSKVIQQDIETTNLDMHTLVTKQLGLLNTKVRNSGASINIIEPLPQVQGNERLVQQCLLNLLSNAIDYRSPNRKLDIEVSGSTCTDFVIINVRDNGIGIASKDQQRIFKIFEHLSEDTGTGVGLAIVKAAMDKHGGKVMLKSAVDTGSSFSLCFPNTTLNTNTIAVEKLRPV